MKTMVYVRMQLHPLPVFCRIQTGERHGLLKKYFLGGSQAGFGGGKNHMPVIIRQPLEIKELYCKCTRNYITLHFPRF